MTTTTLKIIALVAMLLDHIGVFIPNMPEYLRWIGRIAAPIFIYFVGIGYRHTTNKKKFLLRLYIASVGMALVNLVLIAMPGSNYNDNYNFFAPLFLIGLFLYAIEKKKFTYILLWQLISAVPIIFFIEFVVTNKLLDEYFLGAVLGNSLFVEGGILFVLLGVGFYYFQTKKQLTLYYLLFSALIFVITIKRGHMFELHNRLFFKFGDIQWLMLLALPLLLLYNGKKGVGLKYFFYFFYPIHIIVLYFIGRSLQ
ncbi:TraX family protein [Cytobacillus solani]|uniref:Conjugal transfer protein TraX n=1 Tax=Cytobacillus solani TaxID=1637975 RepID=A0A0Q3SG93_9BACI|nr:TraX family protein [Cytobacillus solani]KQL18388.1 hypothetical protein AN957_07260 [Cytobacillus solani]